MDQRNLNFIPVLLWVALALGSSCGGNGNGGQAPGQAPVQAPTQAPPSPGPIASPSASAGPGWSLLREQTTCEAMNPRDCVGAYGFTVDSSGNYTVGPAPDGHKTTGQITQSELNALMDAADTLAASDPSTASQSCTSGGHLPGVNDSVEMTLMSGEVAAVYSRTGVTGTTCTEGDPDSAQSVHATLHSLLMKYYVVPGLMR